MNRKRVNWDIIAVVILILYPLRHMTIGIDLMDAGYSLGNYRYLSVMNENWKLATYLSNLLGAFLMKLPFGKYWIGMNGYTGLMTGAVSAAAYWYCRRFLKNKKLLLFITELTALSLCWAPSVILYQYLGYFFMTIAVMLLYRGMETEKKKYYIIAGVILGMSVLARMPNITYAALILPVWYACYLRKETIRQLLEKTGWCIAGYLLGILPGLGWICLRYGISAYPRMIFSLFSMTEQATDYKPTSMLTSMFADYFSYGVWLIPFFLYLMAGVLFFKATEKKYGKWMPVWKICYLSGIVVLLRFCYGRGMFGFDYQEMFSFYKWTVVYITGVILLCVYLLFAGKADWQKRIWACFLMVMIFITPLGGNNGLYSLVNNLFLIAPVSVWLLAETLPLKKYFAVRATVYFVGGCIVVQSLLFGIFYCFHDKAQSARVEACIPGALSTAGMRTTVDKAQNLQELGGYLEANDLLRKRVILYGNIPSVSYIFGLEPAVYTTWIDLDSNSSVRFAQELQQLSAEDVIVITAAQSEDGNTQKQMLLKNWMDANGYADTFRNEAFVVYQQDEKDN